MEHETTTILCSDWGCRYNGGGGYYGVCQHPGAQNKIPYAGIYRYYQSTCNAKEANETKDNTHHDSVALTENEIELLKRTSIEM